MSEYTPDTLYKWALETGGDIGPVIAHADAWEADQLLLAQWHNEARLRKEEILRLRKRLEAAEQKPKYRMVIVWDGENWHSRHLAYSVQDDVAGEMVYHCDKPLVNDADDVLAALAAGESET